MRASSSLLVLVACAGKSSPAPSDSGDTDTDVAFADAAVALHLEPLPNLLLPFEVAIDETHRRAWVSSLFDEVVGEVDLDSATLVGNWRLPDEEYGQPTVTVDGAGHAWIPSARTVVEVEPGGAATAHDLGWAVRKAYGAPDAGAFVTWEDPDSDFGATLARIDGDGAILAETTIDRDIRVIGPGPGGAVATLTLSSDDVFEIALWDPDTLDPLGTCAAPFIATRFYPLDSGDFFVLDDKVVGYATCDGRDPVFVELGEENKAAAIGADTITVFDRLGDETAEGPYLGMARVLDPDLRVTETWPTGKHSGYGGLDAATGAVWLNSEGTSELVAFDLATGAQTAAVRLGTHVEDFATSDVPGLAWITGRLSGLVERVDLRTGEALAATEAPLWPFSPLWHDETLYVLDQIHGRVYVYDPETMALRTTWETGVEINFDLDFGALAWSEGRDTLLVVLGQSNALFELDPTTGEIVSSFTLGGRAPEPWRTVGRVEIATRGAEVWTVRSTDSTVTHIDLDTAESTTGTLARAAQVQLAQYDVLPTLTWLTEDGAHLYWGIWAFDPATFEAQPEYDRQGARIVGEANGGLITWMSTTGNLVYADAGGTSTEMGNVEFEGDPHARWLGDWGEGVMVVDAVNAVLAWRTMPVPAVRAEHRSAPIDAGSNPYGGQR